VTPALMWLNECSSVSGEDKWQIRLSFTNDILFNFFRGGFYRLYIFWLTKSWLRLPLCVWACLCVACGVFMLWESKAYYDTSVTFLLCGYCVHRRDFCLLDDKNLNLGKLYLLSTNTILISKLYEWKIFSYIYNYG
jgi:hypothetical protein